MEYSTPKFSTFVLCLGIFYAVLPLSNQTTYYVTPDSSTTCPPDHRPCHNLSYYAQDAEHYFANDTEMYFLPGNHVLDKDVNISGIHNFTMVGQSPPECTLSNSNSAAFFFNNSSQLWINNLSFKLFTMIPEYRPIITLNAVEHTTIDDCSFNANFDVSAIYVNDSTNVNLKRNRIFNNIGFTFGTGVKVSFSTVNFTEENCFSDNNAYGGGAIHVQNSTVFFTGNHTFLRNAAIPSTIVGNNGFGGAIVANNSTISFEGPVVFQSNGAQDAAGGALWASYSNITFSGNTSFDHNKAAYDGALSVTNTTVIFRGPANFTNNIGGAVSALESVLEFDSFTEFDSNSFMSNSLTGNGGGLYLECSKMILKGSISLTNNSASHGGGMYAKNTTLCMEGNIDFSMNNANKGGGMFLTENSQLFLYPQCFVFFQENYAYQLGGGLYASMTNPFAYCLPNISRYLDDCFFQLQETNDVNTTIFFDNNFAEEAGSAVYGGSIDRCQLHADQGTSSGRVFNSTVNITENSNTTSDISSEPFKVCACMEGRMNCTLPKIQRDIYPGQSFEVSVVAVGQRDGAVSAKVLSFVLSGTASFGDQESNQLSNNTCTTLSYTIFSRNQSTHLGLYADSPCYTQGQPLRISVNLRPCPNGFTMFKGACVCDKRLQTYTENCYISNQTIVRDGQFWVGFDDQTSSLILHPHCPLSYCKSEPVIFTLNDTDLECAFNHSGLLCGACQPSLSLTLGAPRCKKCSSLFLLWLIPLFGIAGILLVLFLFICRVTVAFGTISGLIFYANIVQGNLSVFLPAGKVNPLTVVIAWINLDLGINTCFFDGMDMYAKTWLQFVFPVYLVCIFVAIAAICRYSRRFVVFGTNLVAVLATLLLLSYAKLLRTVIATLSFTYLEYPHESVAVWAYDGNVRYLHGKHIALFLIVSLFVLVFLLPYTLLVFTWQWLDRPNWRILSWLNNPRIKIKAFMDAYHAPYKNKHRYWPGLLLIWRVVLLSTFTPSSLVDPSVGLLILSACTLGLGMWAWSFGGVYKHQYFDMLEASFVLNLGVLAAGTYHVKQTEGNQEALTYISISVAIVTFIVLVFYHIIKCFEGTTLRRRVLWVQVPVEDGDNESESDDSELLLREEATRNTRPLMSPARAYGSQRQDDSQDDSLDEQ